LILLDLRHFDWFGASNQKFTKNEKMVFSKNKKENKKKWRTQKQNKTKQK